MMQPRYITPRRHLRRGFGVAPILYMLGLIGVIGGTIFSNNMQVLKSNISVQNSLTVRNDLNASSTVLAAQSIFSTDNNLLCPPRSIHLSGGGLCGDAPVGLIQFGDFTSAQHLPVNYATAGTTGSPEEVGVFTVGSTKQLDPYGHAYIYCRWEQPRTDGSVPAFKIISAGPDGNLQTRCGDNTAIGDDSIEVYPVAEAIAHASLWQQTSPTTVAYGPLGSEVVVDNSGDLTANGNIQGKQGLFTSLIVEQQASVFGDTSLLGTLTAGSSTLQNATVGSLQDNGNAIITGNVGIGTPNPTQALSVEGNIGGDLFLSSLQNTPVFASNSDQTLGVGFTGATGSGTGSLQLFTGDAPRLTIDSAGHVLAGTTNLTTGATFEINLGGSHNADLFYVGDATKGITLSDEGTGGDINATAAALYLDNAFGGFPVLVSPNYGTSAHLSIGTLSTAHNLEVNGTANIGATTVSSLTDNGNLSVTGTITGSSATFSGTVTASSFSGSLSVGGSGGVTISGIIPVVNGGTGASSASAALANLGVTSGGVFNTGLLAAGLINGSYLTSGTVTSTQLNATGVVAGNCPSPIVGSDGRVTACGTSVTATAAGSTGDIQFNNGGNFSASNGLFWDNADGYLGIGTSSPSGILDVEGGKAAASKAGTNIKLIAQSGGSGNVNGGSILLTPGAGSGSGFAGSVLIGSTCTAQSWLAYGLCASGDILSEEGFVTQDNQPYGWGVSSSEISGYGESSTNDNIRFLTDNAERGRFDGSGHFGIGTTNPTSALTVVGDESLSGTATIGNALIANGTASLNQGAFVSGGPLSAGDTNLGTTNISTLYVSGIENAGGLVSMNGGGVAQGTFTVYGSTSLVGPVSVAAPAYFNSDVGIGTSSPIAPLDLAGYMRLAKYSSPPITCSSTNDGAVALTAKHTLCVCNGTAWAIAADGSTACSWTGSTPIQIVLSTAGAGAWTVPANWNNANNKVEVVGAGAGGASFNVTSAGSVGGGGGAYSAITNLTLTPGATVNYSIGNGGTGETGSKAAQVGGDTWFNATVYASASVAAKGGSAVSSGNTGGVGGAASSGIGTTKNSGGNGGNSGTNNAGAGGGGAGGPDGIGLNGVAGASGSSSAGSVGGAGDNGNGGLSGTGGTSASNNGGTGGSNTISGGGGGGGYSSDGNGGAGGSAGAGGGGGGSGDNSTIGGQGAVGEIIITYTP